MLSSYFIELHTGVGYAEEEYDAAAGRLVNMCASLLSNGQQIATLTQEYEKCHSEIEVCMEADELIAKIVVDITAATPVKFDKSKLTKLIKAHPLADEWKAMKIYKKLVPAV